MRYPPEQHTALLRMASTDYHFWDMVSYPSVWNLCTFCRLLSCVTRGPTWQDLTYLSVFRSNNPNPELSHQQQWEASYLPHIDIHARVVHPSKTHPSPEWHL
jgi:hypothetical protein